jgi:hypothetical protein
LEESVVDASELVSVAVLVEVDWVAVGPWPPQKWEL